MFRADSNSQKSWEAVKKRIEKKEGQTNHWAMKKQKARKKQKCLVNILRGVNPVYPRQDIFVSSQVWHEGLPLHRPGGAKEAKHLRVLTTARMQMNSTKLPVFLKYCDWE